MKLTASSRSCWRDQHCDPDETVAIFQKLRAQPAFACHCGTFRLTSEPYDEPPRRRGIAGDGLTRGGFAARETLSQGISTLLLPHQKPVASLSEQLKDSETLSGFGGNIDRP